MPALLAPEVHQRLDFLALEAHAATCREAALALGSVLKERQRVIRAWLVKWKKLAAIKQRRHDVATHFTRQMLAQDPTYEGDTDGQESADIESVMDGSPMTRLPPLHIEWVAARMAMPVLPAAGPLPDLHIIDLSRD